MKEMLDRVLDAPKYVRHDADCSCLKHEPFCATGDNPCDCGAFRAERLAEAYELFDADQWLKDMLMSKPKPKR